MVNMKRPLSLRAGHSGLHAWGLKCSGSSFALRVNPSVCFRHFMFAAVHGARPHLPRLPKEPAGDLLRRRRYARRCASAPGVSPRGHGLYWQAHEVD